MTRRESLAELIAKVEAGDASDVCAVLGKMVVKDTPWDFASQVISAHRGSLDAAKTLHEAVLPGWPWSVKTLATDESQVWTNRAYGLHAMGYIGTAKDPARAWLLAILRALHSMEAAE